jgi:hypothetical protein
VVIPSQYYTVQFVLSRSIKRSICRPTKTEKPCMRIATSNALLDRGFWQDGKIGACGRLLKRGVDGGGDRFSSRFLVLDTFFLAAIGLLSLSLMGARLRFFGPLAFLLRLCEVRTAISGRRIDVRSSRKSHTHWR